MTKGRLEAFSDAVLAIIITIMVLEIKAPDEPTFEALVPLFPIFLSYVLSFFYIAIYWVNHHHLFQVTQYINGAVLWVNILFLFCVSLVPFATSWMDENHFEPVPVAVYGFVLMACAVFYKQLELRLIKLHDNNYPLRKALKDAKKENISIFLYGASVPLAFLHTFISLSIYVGIAIWWFIPNKELERSTSTE